VLNISNPNATFTNNSQNANGFLWDFGDGTTSTDLNPWHNYTQSGNYNVMCIAINGVCPNDTSWSTIQVINDVGISENTTIFKIYPNPVVNKLTIEFKNMGLNTALYILDSRGRTVKSIHIESTLSTINTTDLVKGIYFIKIVTDENVLFKEFIKQ
jgi:hypothetical protein